MKQPGRQASGQDGSHSPSRHSGKELTAGGGRQGPLPFLYTAAQSALSISVSGQGSGRRMLTYGMAAPERARMWTGKNVQVTGMVLTISPFAERSRRVFHCPASTAHRVLCEKKAGLN